MDTNLQAIMARRRKLAEGGGGNEEKKPDPTPAPAPAAASAPAPPPPPPATSPPSKGGNLQDIMARRRRMADGGGDVTPAPTAADTKKEGAEITAEDSRHHQYHHHQGRNLQDIMARRRRLADAPAPAPAPDTKKEDTEMTMEDLHHHHSLRRTGGVGSNSRSSLQGSGSFEMNAHSSTGDNLHSIMERRRRLADGDEAPAATTTSTSPPHSPPTRSLSSFPISSMQSLPAQRRGSASALSYTPQGLSSPIRSVGRTGSVERRGSLAPGEKPSASASPVKKDLKNFSMSSDLKAIMDRRRKLASAEVTDDEDPPMVQDEDPPMSVIPSLHAEEDEPEKLPEPKEDESKPPNEPPPATERQEDSSGGLDKSSHSVEMDVSSTHGPKVPEASAHEKEPLLDMEESDEEDSEEEDANMRMPTPPVRESKRSLTGSRQSSRRSDLGSSSHSNKGDLGRHSSRGSNRVSSHDKKQTSQEPSLLDEDEDSVGEEDDDVMMVDATPTVEKPVAETPRPLQEKKRRTFLDDSSDEEGSSSSDSDKKRAIPAPAPVDSPTAAVMGIPTEDTAEAKVAEEEDDDDEKEVELFAAALEKDEPDEGDSGDRPKELETAQSHASEEADEVGDLPGKGLKKKLARGRRKSDSSLSQTSEEASVDPSVDSRTSAGSAGNGSASGSSSSRRAKNRKGGTNDASQRKSTTSSSASRGRSTKTPTSNDERRKKPTKSRRSAPTDRSQSGSSAEDRPDGRGGRRRSIIKDTDDTTSRDADDATRVSQESGGESVPSTAPESQESTPAAAGDAFGSGEWGGFGAFGDKGTAASTGREGGERSGVTTDVFGGGAFGSGGRADTFGGDAFESEGGFPGSGGGDAFGASSGADAFPASSDGFSGAFMADFGDTTAFPTAPASKEGKVDFADNAFGGRASGGFNDAFGNFDTTNAFGTSGPDAFEQVNFSAPPVKEEIVYETSPLSGVPVRSQPVPAIYQKTVLRGPFEGSLSTNALNGNLIVCSETGDGIVLREIDPRRQYLQIAAAPIVSPELRLKVTAKFNLAAHSVESVIRVSSGLHYEQGQTRLRVGAILDLKVLEVPQPLRLVAIWTWGQGGTHPISLQYALSPPSGGDFTYDAASLVMADNLIFLAGTSPKGPCVFVSKPAVRESWTANSLPGSGNVTAMEVTPHLDRDQPYLAIGLTDRSVSIWTYREAMEGVASKGKESGPKRWLFPLCRLESTKTLSGIDATSLNPSGTATGQDSKNSGHCTHFAWLPRRHSMSCLSLLAAFFQNGLAIYHIALPAMNDKKGPKPLPEPTASTTMGQTPRLWPMVAKRWQGKHEQSFGAWVDLGPHANPGLSTLLHANDFSSARVIFGIINVPSHRRGLMPREKLLPFRILATKTIAKSSESFPKSVVLQHDLGTFLCYSEDRLFSISLATDAANGSVRSLFYPVSSQPTGMSSLGENHLPESVSDKDGILHIFSLEHCERNKIEGDVVEWSRPSRRFWLCKTVPGDNKECVAGESKEDKPTSNFGDAEVEKGGALSDTICEIYDDKLIGLVPLRISRCQGADICAILYRPSLCSKTGYKEGMAMDAVAIAVIDYSSSEPLIEVLEGRDISFWGLENGVPRGSILTKGGLSVVYFSWDAEIGACEFGASYRPLLGVEDDKDYVECRRVYCYAGSSKVGVVSIGTKLRDNRICIVGGDLCPETELTSDKWSSLLPNIVTGRASWLKANEEVFSIVGLECDDSGYRNFALCTSERVIILSSAMEITAEIRASVSSPALAPLGAFAVGFISDGKFCYLCCLDGRLVSNSIATLTHGGHGSQHCCLLAVRPDRIIVSLWHHAVRLVENSQRVDSFVLPAAYTRPVLLLEPMVANAICVGGKLNQSTQVLRIIIEKFGRKAASLTHGEEEGIGNKGTGISARTLAILEFYGLKEAASWLLTGVIKFDRSANTTILPPWVPVSAKSKGAISSNGFFHVISNGDQYLSDYLKAPDSGAVASLPRRSDPSSYTALEKAEEYLRAGQAVDALKTFDLGGSEKSDALLVQLSLLLEKDSSKDLSGIIQAISGLGQGGLSRSAGPKKLPSSLAALSLSLKQARNRGQEPGMAPENIIRWMVPTAPSLQKGSKMGRLRGSIFGEEMLEKAGDVKENLSDSIWASACSEAKHVWNEGPKKEKDKLLMLDRVDDWLGRRRPIIIGKEGASAARDGGEKILADLLNMDDNSFGGKSDLESEKDGWVEGVGEGRSDEANLSSYFRMSEGEEEDSPWRSEGMLDISPYQNKAIVYGDTERFSLETSTSSVDEGEPGKVKALFDLVFEGSSIGALALAATRGGSLDIGVLHGPDRQARQKCTLEFWYYLPEPIKSDVVLVRRTLGPDAGDLSKVTVAFDRDSVLWEVILQKKGSLELRTCGGSKVNSFNKDFKAEDDDESERPDVVQFGRWNHVCVILSSKNFDSITDCNATILMKGVSVIESDVSMLPSGFDEEDLESSSTLNDILQKSHIVFGLNNPTGFRMTELRVWAVVRSEDDVKAMMYEYLNAAESKKKFKVKIKIKNKGGGLTLGKGGMLSGPQRGVTAEKSGIVPKMTLSLAPKISLAPQPKEDKPEDGKATPQTGFEPSFDTFGNQGQVPATAEEAETEEDAPTSLWDTAVPLSQQVRSSAAAALIRGPPATRHFGGNRGGLPDFSGMERYGVGGVAICGSEKTIVFRDNEDPPALTYPIGASGAVVSDQMDDEGSEFLCCFLARDRRMVVFELQSRTVVVELQMTTKLNFWRFLPPEAGENTLCFMLVTPVGGFHWMPLDESPRPHQVWKRGPDLQGKKIVSYEEGGSNGADGPDILSTVGLIMVTKASAGGALEAWIVPIAGDSVAKQVSEDVMGACLCLPPDVDDGPFLPLLVAILQVGDGVYVNVMSLFEDKRGSVELGEIAVTIDVDLAGFEDVEYEPPTLAMGTYPAAICCSLANIVVVIMRSKGLVVAYELEDGDMSLIAREGVGHYVIDAVMRYSEEVGGAEIVMLLSDTENTKDGRMVSFCFRSAG